MASPNLSGSLQGIPLSDIARLLQTTLRSGHLALTMDDSTGSIYFDRGEIIDCQSSQLSGLDAIRHLALFNRGSFEFFDNVSTDLRGLADYPTDELLRVLETCMLEARQIQELMPNEHDIPHYLGGSMPSSFEVTAADLAVAMKSSAGAMSTAHLAQELGLDLMAVRYIIARFRAVGLMELREGASRTGPIPPPPEREIIPPKTEAPSPMPTAPASETAAPQPRYWRGRRIG
jgi:hypothetical protein